MSLSHSFKSTYRFWKHALKKDFLDLVIFYVTSACNSKCPGCFFSEGLNQGNDLTLDEIRKISPTIGPVANFLFSGGEPFLRKELNEIIDIFMKNNRPQTLSIPTNGLDPDRIFSVMDRACADYPEVYFTANPSVDGIGETHDTIRAVPGNYSKVTATIDRLLELREKRPNFAILVNTAVFDQDLAELKELFAIIRGKGVDTHFVEIDRGLYPPNMGEAAPAERLEYIHEVHRLAIENSSHYLDNLKRRTRMSLFRTIFYHKTPHLYDVQETVLSGEKLPFPCVAGRLTGVINPDGDVRVCEPKVPIANLRDHNYDFQSVWRLPHVEELRKEIVDERCTCTHCVFLDFSMIHSPRTLLYNLPRNYVKNRKVRNSAPSERALSVED